MKKASFNWNVEIDIKYIQNSPKEVESATGYICMDKTKIFQIPIPTAMAQAYNPDGVEWDTSLVDYVQETFAGHMHKLMQFQSWR